MATITTILLTLLTALLTGCGSAATAPTAPPLPPIAATPLPSLNLQPILGGYEPQSPTNLIQTPGGRLLVTEQPGRILIFDPSQPENPPAVFMDLRDQVSDRGWEEGLLGIALSPDFAQTGHFYVHYSAANPRRSVISRFTANPPRDSADLAPFILSLSQDADPATELPILQVPQPYPNHNGGQIAFGPDGYLYIALGDGGAGGDPQNNGQDPSTLLGAILRLDVAQAAPQQPYAIPPDNPFAADHPDNQNPDARPEIWAYGLRNPWRFSFDRQTGQLWAGDVGQDRHEEIDIITPRGNYGWNILEGAQCFNPRQDCQREGTIPPIWHYPLTGGACSVIGGYIYRGAAIPQLSGVYLFADFCNGQIHGLRPNAPEISAQLLIETGLRITSFAQDNHGELYILSQNSGIYLLTPTAP